MKKLFGLIISLPLLIAVARTPALAEDQLIPLRLSLGDLSIGKLIFIVAGEAGIYRKNGLDVHLTIAQRAVEAGKRNGLTVPPQYIQKVAEEDGPIAIIGGVPLLVGIATNARAVNRTILATTDSIVLGHIVAGRDITKPEQLRGKRLGYTGYGSHTQFVAILFAKHMGWDPDQDLSLMSNGAGIDTLRDGSVDAFVADEFTRALAENQGFHSILDLSTLKLPAPGSSIDATTSWLKDNRETARRFIKCLVEAIALMKQDKNVTFQAMAKWWGVTDPKRQEMFYMAVADIPQKPYPAVEGIKKLMEVQNYREMKKHKPEDFYDDSFVKELDQSGYIESLYR